MSDHSPPYANHTSEHSLEHSPKLTQRIEGLLVCKITNAIAFTSSSFVPLPCAHVHTGNPHIATCCTNPPTYSYYTFYLHTTLHGHPTDNAHTMQPTLLSLLRQLLPLLTTYHLRNTGFSIAARIQPDTSSTTLPQTYSIHFGSINIINRTATRARALSILGLLLCKLFT